MQRIVVHRLVPKQVHGERFRLARRRQHRQAERPGARRQRRGQQGQGVGYLEDGTMVVVEDGLKFRGKPTRVLVVNNVQTNVGRMIFARPERSDAA